MNQGETIELPAATMGASEGDLVDGSNTLRRIIHRDFTPTIRGEKPQPAIIFHRGSEVRIESTTRTA